jgi:hypothetical protein
MTNVSKLIFGAAIAVFAAVVCFEKTRRGPKPFVVCRIRFWRRRCHELWVRNVSTMFGRRERGWRVVSARLSSSSRRYS